MATKQCKRLDDIGTFVRSLDERSREEISPATFKQQTVPVLREFLKYHGIQCSEMGKAYAKEKLVLLSFNAWKLRLDNIDSDKEDQSSIILEKHLTPEGKMLPLVSSIDKGWSKDLYNCAHFTYPDLYNYLIVKPGYDHESLKSFKGLLGYKLYQDGHVRSLEHVRVDGQFSYVRFEVYPTERKKTWNGREFYEGWTIIKGFGEVLSGHCNCFGGADGACRHLAAALFDLTHCLTNRDEGPSCTDKKCTWIQKKRDLAPTPASNIVLGKKITSQQEHDLDAVTSVSQPHLYDPRPSYVAAGEKQRQLHLHLLINDLSPEAVCLHTLPEIPGTNNFPPESDVNVSNMEEMSSQMHVPRMGEIVHDAVNEYNKLQLKELNLTQFANQYIQHQTFSKEQISEVNRITLGQSDNQEWRQQRQGRITASVAHRIYTRKPSTDPCSLVNTIMGKDVLDEDHLPCQIKYGRVHEEDAIRHYTFVKKKSCGAKFRVQKTGLMVLPNYPYLAASPDGLTSENRIVEVKCLWKSRNKTPKEAAVESRNVEVRNGCLCLKANNSWYSQMQFQMKSCDVNSGDLVIYTNMGIAVIPVQFNATYWAILLDKMNAFFVNYVLPEFLKNS